MGIFVVINRNTPSENYYSFLLYDKNHSNIKKRSCTMKTFSQCPTINISNLNV